MAKTKKLKKNVLKNRITIILDSSGSMQSLKSEVISGLNNQIKTLLKNNKEMDTKVSLITFSDKTNQYSFYNEELENVKQLTENDYNPYGWTALYDTIGSVITNYRLMPEYNDENCSYLLFIVTDGHENQSKIWNFNQVSSLIKEVESTKRWTITYLGAGEGLKDVGTNLGLNATNTFSGSVLRDSGVFTSYAAAAATNFMDARFSGQTQVQDIFNVKKEEEKK